MLHLDKIRNFCIIAHIDHGKSTLADRFLEITKTIEKRLMKEQYLDQLESERERGITIKMAPVRMSYKGHTMNLIDTPGHSDFGYEVSRALAAVEGAILLVDATQGIQAQTLANFENARKAGLKIIGAVNKIDLKPPQTEEIIKDLADLINTMPEEIVRVSGKTGEGVELLLDKVIKDVPPPTSENRNNDRALIFDSLYDDHKGVIAFVRAIDGNFTENQQIIFTATQTTGKIKEVGYFTPKLKASLELRAGEIGYIATGLKDPQKLKIGDTIFVGNIQKNLIWPGYKEPQPVVFVSFYPEDTNEYDELKKSLEKLKLNDASLTFEPDSSEMLGRGFKCGFLGRLHFEIIAERLKKEFDIDTVHSFPSVAYKVGIKGGEQIIKNPKDFPAEKDWAEEPMTKVEILTPPEYLGSILSLKEIFRFNNFETENIGRNVMVRAKLPLADLISDLDDKLKSATQGYASLSYEIVGYERADLEKLEILVAGHTVPGLTRILPKEKLERGGRYTIEKLKDLLPRQQFAQALQAAVRGKIIARENIPAMRKDVTGYLYGGDRSRKMKLWKKQQRGKARLKEMAEHAGAQIKIPASVFKELLKK